jgi:hypothetical protein
MYHAAFGMEKRVSRVSVYGTNFMPTDQTGTTRYGTGVALCGRARSMGEALTDLFEGCTGPGHYLVVRNKSAPADDASEAAVMCYNVGLASVTRYTAAALVQKIGYPAPL